MDVKETLKYLGVTFGEILNWDERVERKLITQRGYKKTTYKRSCYASHQLMLQFLEQHICSQPRKV